MRSLNELNKYRIISKRVMEIYGSIGDESNGAFSVKSPVDASQLVVIASTDDEWEHVSVSRRTRPPSWREMEYIAKMFFNENETWVQYHVPKSEHVNIHPNCLHWWRSVNKTFPRPPSEMV